MHKKGWVFSTAVSWFLMGAFLFFKAINMLHTLWQKQGEGTSKIGLILWACSAVVIGFFKGNFLLRKSAFKMMSRIATLDDKKGFFHVYSPKYLLLLASMMGLGVLLRLFPISPMIHSFCNLAIGSALMTGSSWYSHWKKFVVPFR